MDSQTQRNLNAYFGLQKVMHTQLFERPFVRSTNWELQLALGFGDGTKNTKLEGTIYRGGSHYPQISDEKENTIKAMFSDNSTIQ